MSRFWTFVFLLVPILGVWLFWWAPGAGYDMPRDVSAHGYMIDHLYYFILGLTGVVFVATEGCLFWFLWKYSRGHNRAPVKYTHGNHTLENVWTILTAATLLFIAIYQMNAWAEVKIHVPNVAPAVEVTARQFEWRFRYPGLDGKLYTPDDVYHVNDLVLPANEMILVRLKSQDVLHDFFVPNLRIKQDAVPGKDIPVWFRAKEQGQFDLVCAELCGWGHYKMKGRVSVVSREDFDRWIADKSAEQQFAGKPAEE